MMIIIIILAANSLYFRIHNQYYFKYSTVADLWHIDVIFMTTIIAKRH